MAKSFFQMKATGSIPIGVAEATSAGPETATSPFDQAKGRRPQLISAIAEQFKWDSEFATDLLPLIVEQCKQDPRLLDRALKALKPLRGKGGIKAPPWREAVIDGIMSVAERAAWTPAQTWETLGVTLRVSEAQAKRLYYSHQRGRRG